MHRWVMARVAAMVIVFVTGVWQATPAQADAIIVYGNTALGVNDQGHLNVFGLGPGGFDGYGVYRLGVGDAIYPGCLCEGWGVAVTDPFGNRIAGYASVDNGGIAGLTGGTFGSTTATASSTVGLQGYPVTVEHFFGPSLAADVFQVQVRITNDGTAPVTDLVYRRAMDWDVPPTEFFEFVTHGGVEANLESNGGNVRFASDNGFAFVDPRFGAGQILGGTVNVDFVDSGPADHGSVFDFAFGDLTPGESRIFNIFYGSANSEGGAMAALSALGADVYSLGQQAGDPTGGSPATFLFAFGGVGGVEPGLDPNNPVLPFVPAPGQYEFPAPTPRRWFDPPFASGFTYELTGGALFTEVKAPPASFGFGPLDVFIPGLGIVGTIGAGDPDPLVAGFDLTPYATAIFSLLGISPLVDAGDPTLFPTFLDWSGAASLLTMTAIVPTPSVPEPGLLVLMGLGGLALARRGLQHRFARH